MSRTKFLGLSAILLCLAIVFGGRALWFLSYATLLSLILPLLHSLLGILLLRGSMAAPKAVINAGEELLLTYTLENPSALAFPSIEFVENRSFGGGPLRGRFISLDAKSAQRWETRVRFERRGRYRHGDVRLVLRDLYGFFALRKRIRSPLEITVLPHILVLEDIRPDGLRQLGDLPVRDPFARDLAELANMREYQPGEALHSIHWRLSARSGTLIAKQFERRGEASLQLIIDDDARNYRHDTDGRIADLIADAASSVLYYLLRRSVPCRLLCPVDNRIMELHAADLTGFNPLLETLAAFRPGSGLGAGLLARGRAMAATQATILYMSPRLSRSVATGLLDCKLAAFSPSLLLAGPAGLDVQTGSHYGRVLEAEKIPVMRLTSRKELTNVLRSLR